MDVSTLTSLVTSEHRDKPKFMATLTGILQPLSDSITLISSFPSLYDVDNAVGEQLDVVGLWVGISRRVALPITTWFSWDTQGLGWDQGVWWGVGDPTENTTSLSDTTYRELIYAKIACNNWDGSAAGALQIITQLVSPDGCTVALTEGTMSATFTISGPISDLRKSIIEKGYLPLNSAGVSVSYEFSGD